MRQRRQRTNPTNDNPQQLAFDFERKVDSVIQRFAVDVRRRGPKAVARDLGLARVAPHWRKIGGDR